MMVSSSPVRLSQSQGLCAQGLRASQPQFQGIFDDRQPGLGGLATETTGKWWRVYGLQNKRTQAVVNGVATVVLLATATVVPVFGWIPFVAALGTGVNCAVKAKQAKEQGM